MSVANVLLLADESAGWKVAGLRQIDRLALAVKAFFRRQSEPVEVFLLVKPSLACVAPAATAGAGFKFIPLCDDSAAQNLPASFDLVVSTRMFVPRESDWNNRVPQHFEVRAGETLADCFERAAAAITTAFPVDTAIEPSAVVLLSNRAAARRRAGLLLRTSTSKGDGFVSRYLNRPVSRAVSRLVVNLPVTPNQWSVAITIVPLIACFYLVRGGYWGFVVGTLLLHFHSVLDGCDGEIARAKYLESEEGRRLDAVCDLATTILFVASLGVGLFHSANLSHSWQILYFGEGLLAAVLIGMQWYITHRQASSFGSLTRRGFDSLGLGPAKPTGAGSGFPVMLAAHLREFLVEISKRDVAHLGFVVLALANLAPCILHIILIFALVSLVLSTVAMAGSQKPSPALATASGQSR